MFVSPVGPAMHRSGTSRAYAWRTQFTTPGKTAAAIPEIGAGYTALTTEGFSGSTKSIASKTPWLIGTCGNTAFVATIAAENVHDTGALIAPLAWGSERLKSYVARSPAIVSDIRIPTGPLPEIPGSESTNVSTSHVPSSN